MTDKRLWTIKIVALCLVTVAVVIAGMEFYAHRHYKEPVVMGPGVTEVKKLSDYYPAFKGSVNDCNIYILDSGKPGGTIAILGGTHPEEPASNLAAEIFVENAQPESGRLIVAIRANRSASTVTRPGDAYPNFYHIETPWGLKKYRMGDRWTNPLDSWPDPEVYVHYPSRQMLAYMDIRNLNRTWPGKEDGTITEQTAHAFIQMINAEKVDLFIDFHEAELEYPVISTIVAHQKGTAYAGMASMMLTATEFKIGMEYSPKSLHGLSHREVGDATDAVSLLFETPEPFLDRVRGVTDEKLLLTGQDPFVMVAGKKGLLYETIDEKGWPIDVRVGRHISTVLEIVNTWTDMNFDKPIVMQNVPRYADVIANGVGYYLLNPEQAAESQIIYE